MVQSSIFGSLLKSKSRLEAENAALRHQLIVLQRKVRGRVHFTNGDRLFFVQLYRWFPSVLKAGRSSGPRLLCAGIVPAFAAIGAGNRCEIERHRAVLGATLRQNVQQIEDGEFEVIETTPAHRKKAS